MSMAREIADEAGRCTIGGREQWSGSAIGRDELESLISAKLHPVKHMILELLTASLVGCDESGVQYICPPAFDKAVQAAAELAPQFGMVITERGVALVREETP